MQTSNPYLLGSGAPPKTAEGKKTIDKEALRAKLESQIKESAQGKRMADMTQSEVHNHTVQSQNKHFVQTLVRKVTIANDYETSECSVDESVFSNTQRPQLMVMNIDLGKHGFRVITCMDNEDPKKVAKRFCKENKLGPNT